MSVTIRWFRTAALGTCADRADRRQAGPLMFGQQAEQLDVFGPQASEFVLGHATSLRLPAPHRLYGARRRCAMVLTRATVDSNHLAPWQFRGGYASSVGT